jgi:hypothetical protein
MACELVLSPGPKTIEDYQQAIDDLLNHVAGIWPGDAAGVARDLRPQLLGRLDLVRSEQHTEWLTSEIDFVGSLSGQARCEFDLDGYREKLLATDLKWFDAVRERCIPRFPPGAEQAFRLGEVIEIGLYPHYAVGSGFDRQSSPPVEFLGFGSPIPQLEKSPLELGGPGRVPGDRPWPGWWPDQLLLLWQTCHLPVESIVFVKGDTPAERVLFANALKRPAAEALGAPPDTRSEFAERFQILSESERTVSLDGHIYRVKYPKAFTVIRLLAEAPDFRMEGKQLRLQAGYEVKSNLTQYLRRHLPPELHSLVEGKSGEGSFQLILPPRPVTKW